MTFLRKAQFALILSTVAPLISTPTLAVEKTGGLLQCIKRAFRGKTQPATISSEVVAQSWSKEDREAALKLYREKRLETLDLDSTSLESRLARSLSGNDLFEPQFQGSLDEMVKRDVFRGHNVYGIKNPAPRSFWWKEQTISATNSLSPNVGLYLREVRQPSDVSRTIYWPQSHGETGGLSTNFKNYRVAINKIYKDGKYLDRSAEVIGYNEKTGEYIPFLYEPRDGKWVLSRTFQGRPTREVCITCHSSPANPDVFTPVPWRKLKTREDFEKVGYDYQAVRGLLETMRH